MAKKLVEEGFARSDHNPAVFYRNDMICEQHGDDFFVEGVRAVVSDLREWFKLNFKVKKASIISMHPEDDKEASYLHRRIYCDEQG